MALNRIIAFSVFGVLALVYWAAGAGTSGFTARGFAHSSFILEEDNTSFGDLGLVPIFLWESDRILVESELEIMASGDHGTELGLGYMTLNYDLNSKLRLQAGKFLLPFGIFGSRLHPTWINKLPTTPLGFGHDGLIPTADLGVQLRGVFPAGNFRLGYSTYVINGPQLATDSANAGMLRFSSEDNNSNKALGGRLEIVRLSQGTWEIGISGLAGESGPDSLQAMAILGAVDFSYSRPSPILRGVVDVKAQGNWIQVDRKDYPIGSNFHNQSWSYFAQLAYRPSLLNRQWLRDLEAVGRLGQIGYAHGAPWSKEGTEWAAGLNYWLSWNALVKVAWVAGGEDSHSTAPGGMDMVAEDGGHMDGKLVVQMAVGL